MARSGRRTPQSARNRPRPDSHRPACERRFLVLFNVQRRSLHVIPFDVPNDRQKATTPVTAVLQVTLNLDDDVVGFEPAAPPIAHPWRLRIQTDAADGLPSFPSTFPRSKDERVRYWAAIVELTHTELGFARHLWPFAVSSEDGLSRYLSFDPFFPEELHFLVPAGRLARAAADAGLYRDPVQPPRVAAATVSPADVTIVPADAVEAVGGSAATPAAAIVTPVTPAAVPVVPGSSALSHSVGFDLGTLAGALPHAAADSSQAHVLPGAFSTTAATLPPFPVTADTGVADDGYDIYADLYDTPAVPPVQVPRPVTPLPTTPPSPVPLRTTRSCVRLATPIPMTPASPLAGHTYASYRPPLSAAVPPSAGMSFYTAAAHASPTPAPHLPPTPVPFAGWGPSWTPAKTEALSPPPSSPSPYPRRAPTSVALPDAWHPPMPTAIPPSDADHYAQRFAELNAREASLFALEQRLRDMMEQHAAALSALAAAAAPPSPSGGSSSSSPSSFARRGSRGSAAPRDRSAGPGSESAPPHGGIKDPPALIKPAAEDVGKIRFDGKTGMPAF
ncbi:hypothetical protein HDU96_003033, partial [Phlyctochytrium bullatum]